MKIVIYIVLVLSSAALHTYHPKSQTSTPTHISKRVASEKADMNSIALNSTGAYQVAAQSN